jgi:hypothetical protein
MGIARRAWRSATEPSVLVNYGRWLSTMQPRASRSCPSDRKKSRSVGHHRLERSIAVAQQNTYVPRNSARSGDRSRVRYHYVKLAASIQVRKRHRSAPRPSHGFFADTARTVGRRWLESFHRRCPAVRSSIRVRSWRFRSQRPCQDCYCRSRPLRQQSRHANRPSRNRPQAQSSSLRRSSERQP